MVTVGADLFLGKGFPILPPKARKQNLSKKHLTFYVSFDDGAKLIEDHCSGSPSLFNSSIFQLFLCSAFVPQFYTAVIVCK